MLDIVRRVVRAYRAAFAGLGREVWLLAGSALVNRAGTMVLPFLSLYLTRRLGLTPLEAGQILALYGVGSVIGSWVGGWLSDRIGAVQVQLLSFVAAGFAFLVLGSARSFSGVAMAVLAAAILADSHRPAMMAAVSHYSEPATRTRAFALIRLAINLGMAVGPAVGGILAVRHYGWLFIGDALTCWAAALLLVLTLGLPEERVRRGDGPRRRGGTSPWRDVPFVAFLLLVFVLGAMFFQIWSTMPLDLRDVHGLTEPAIGGIFALNALLVVLFEMLLLRALEDREPLRVLGVGAGLVGAGLGLLAMGRGYAIAFASMLGWTLGEMLSLPMSNVIVANRAPTERIGSYMGAYSMAFALAFVVAPITGTAVYQRWGGVALWPSLAVVGLVVGVGFASMRRPLAHGVAHEEDLSVTPAPGDGAGPS